MAAGFSRRFAQHFFAVRRVSGFGFALVFDGGFVNGHETVNIFPFKAFLKAAAFVFVAFAVAFRFFYA
jgi:hypothetical protein